MKRRTLCVLLYLLFAIPFAKSGTLAQFRTVYGDIDVELYDLDKPVTVQNFLRYTQSGTYDSMFFHRCFPGFLIRGGRYRVTDRADTNNATTFRGVPFFAPITNEFNVGTLRSNVFGTIAMFKNSDSDPNSATSEWFFNLADNSADLDSQNGGSVVFGNVVRGTNVLNYIDTLFKSETNSSGAIVDLRWWLGNGELATLFSDLPVNPFNHPGLDYPRYVDLVFVDVSLLSVEVQATGSGSRQISWNSVSNKVNTVEFTTKFPPVWQTLTTTNGTGNTLTVIDSNSTNKRRFYRVRVDY